MSDWSTRQAKVVYADESGWRMDGDNWYSWAFVDKESGAIRYEVVTPPEMYSAMAKTRSLSVTATPSTTAYQVHPAMLGALGSVRTSVCSAAR